MTLAILLLTLAKAPGDNYARYLAFFAAHPSFKVNFSVKYNGHPGPTGIVYVYRPHRMLFKGQFGTLDFSVSDTEKGYVEIENSLKKYDEYPAQGRPIIFMSDLDPLISKLAPRIVLLPDLKPFFPEKALIADSDPSMLHFKSSSPMGTVELWGQVDPSGRLSTVRQLSSGGPSGKQDIQWEFSNYTYPPNPTLASFLTPLPLGYVPRTVPRLEQPLQKKADAPVAGWISPTGQTCNLLTLAGNKPFLLAVLGGDSVPSKELLNHIRTLKTALPIFVVGSGGYRDPDGSRLAKLSPPGTPMVYLIGSDGKVAKLWLGFDSQHPEKFDQDIETVK